jgi:hypothetical protein
MSGRWPLLKRHGPTYHHLYWRKWMIWDPLCWIFNFGMDDHVPVWNWPIMAVSGKFHFSFVYKLLDYAGTWTLPKSCAWTSIASYQIWLLVPFRLIFLISSFSWIGWKLNWPDTGTVRFSTEEKPGTYFE